MARRLALLIRNSKFSDADIFPELRTAVNDAQDLTALLEKHGEFEIVGLCLNEDASTVKDAIEGLFEQIQETVL